MRACRSRYGRRWPVHDNPHAFLMCIHQSDRALCHRAEVADTPRLDRCRPACANVARTDRHADALLRHAAALEVQAHAVPGPLAERLTQRAIHSRSLAARHAHDRHYQEPPS
ncbi:hypothetical protein [Streptomyces smyrnaeus]|uniref:hypothetical protein n=1 Tax=Streptomyces smyrnaeus TaxID=1387713 RepID=UPI0033D50215